MFSYSTAANHFDDGFFCKMECFFARGLCKVLLCCLRDVKSCAREILSRELCKKVFLPERCQKLCKRDYFKRVVQECFLPERCPELHKIYCCPDSWAKERFTYFCFFWKLLKIIEQCFSSIFYTSLLTIS